jgi:hypothetical protein
VSLLVKIAEGDHGFLNGFLVSRPLQSAKDNEHTGRQITCKTTQDVKRIRELTHGNRPRRIHEPAETVGISYGECPDLLTYNLNIRLVALKFVPRFLELVVIVPHFLYSPNVTSSDFALFPKLKMKLKEKRSERVSDI